MGEGLAPELFFCRWLQGRGSIKSVKLIGLISEPRKRGRRKMTWVGKEMMKNRIDCFLETLLADEEGV